jgi:hypothetical protein
VRSELRATLLHELHHLVRYETVVDRDLQGGRGSRRTRDGVRSRLRRREATMGPVPERGRLMAREVLAVPPGRARDGWRRRRPDGRRCVAMRVRTSLVDRAMRASGKTGAELVQVPTDATL